MPHPPPSSRLQAGIRPSLRRAVPNHRIAARVLSAHISVTKKCHQDARVYGPMRMPIIAERISSGLSLLTGLDGSPTKPGMTQRVARPALNQTVPVGGRIRSCIKPDRREAWLRHDAMGWGEFQC